MAKIHYFNNHFLIAMPSLKDPNFTKAVILLCEHNKEGAMGIIINKPLHVTLGSVLEHLDLTPANATIENTPVFMGGPVGQEHGFVIHEPYRPEEVDEELVISASRDTLADIAQDAGPSKFLVTLGYAGWEPDQLSAEMNRNDWLVVPYDKDILFNTPVDARWERATNLLGVNPHHLSSHIGHA